MKKLIVGFTAGVVLGVGLGGAFSGHMGGAGAVMAQGGGAGENTVKVVLENARVRVREVTFAPKVTNAMHTHSLPHVGIVIQGGTLTFRYPDGKTETEKLATGGVGYRDANVTHEPTNVGSTPVRVIEVELK
jgi:quercetin dioxygenase-like cupin family protein